jgi:hypothetical protein
MRPFLTFATFIAALLWLTASVKAAEIYSNSFNRPVGTSYPEWSSSVITYTSTANPPGSGTLPAPAVINTVSPNHAQRFLGELGGPPIGIPRDPGYNHTLVDQTVSLSLRNLPAHSTLQVAFDLYILKSWDGNSPAYGPDRFVLSVAGGPTLLDTTFSNNPKTNTDGSYQDYPATNSAPWSGAFSTNTLGYSSFFHDGIYRLQFTFAHTGSNVMLNFRSSLFEGKGTVDESWGLDNVSISTASRTASLNIYRPWRRAVTPWPGRPAMMNPVRRYEELLSLWMMSL